ncbi:MAG TPA: helix-turn-helix transcriptional regulator [Allocoleopsis sp.]
MAQDYDSQIGENLRRLREEAGLPKIKLARLVHIDRRQIDHIESGQRPVRLSEMVHFANAYGMKPTEFTSRVLEW